MENEREDTSIADTPSERGDAAIVTLKPYASSSSASSTDSRPASWLSSAATASGLSDSAVLTISS